MFLSPGEMWNESKTLSQGTQIDILTLPYQLCDLRPLLNLLRYQCSAHLWIEDNNIKIKVLNENIQHTASNRDPHRAHVKPVARSELATKTTLLRPPFHLHHHRGRQISRNLPFTTKLMLSPPLF